MSDGNLPGMASLDSASTGPSKTIPRDGVVRIAREVILSVLNLELDASVICDDTDLFGLGADSMSIVELFFQLEERFSLRFDESELSADIFKRFGGLVTFVQDHLDRRAA